MERRPSTRGTLQIRPTTIETGVNLYAEGSALIRMGNTQVLCTASIEESVPKWLEGKGRGWITAEYSMLPRSTHTRTKRDREKISGRTQEIQRLIGRALRSMVDLNLLGERSILVDCDVLQADGGTRTASINGACIAVAQALHRLHLQHRIPVAAWRGTVSAISLGLHQGELLVDLDYPEDSQCDIDMNFVITGAGGLIEVQGTAERQSFTQSQLEQMTHAAFQACAEVKTLQLEAMQQLGIAL
jgi:ribonuclease PH